MDFWFNVFNIAVVSSMGALVLLFLASIIIIAAIGKRKCNAFDVIFRIITAIVVVATAVMFTCSVLSMVTGDTLRIAVFNYEPMGDDVRAALVFNGKYHELPIPKLFVFLATTIGSNVTIALFLCSLAALIVDCLVANKKEKKEKKEKQAKAAAQKKTPEQLKREAELERIRKIGESAVKKTSAVAEKQAATEKAEAEEKPETAEPEKTDEGADFDWRTADEKQEQKPTEFVGIKDTAEDDSFDSFDDNFDSDESEAEQAPETEADEFDDDTAINASDEDTAFSVEPESDEVEEVDDGVDEFEEADDSFDDLPDDEEYESVDLDGQDPLPVDTFDDISDEDLANADDDIDIDELDKATIGASAVIEEQDQAFEQTQDEQSQATEQVKPSAPGEVEPDRDIYIPNIRTVVRTAPDASERTEPARRPDPAARRPQTRPSTAAKKSDAATKKPASTRPPRKPSTAPRRPAQTKSNSVTSPEKKLPLTRRYVILDRRNAVNMFGEYLKERDRNAKDKLEKSINTIIIE
ncbi:MAG: hypothetical protein HDT28_02025 [Clostridiales bacterium]|nr:hypothetical protein [Clostridiales bacterium]